MPPCALLSVQRSVPERMRCSHNKPVRVLCVLNACRMVRVLVSTAVMEAVALQQTRGCPYERSQAPTENGGEQTFAVAAAMQQAQDSQDTGQAALLRHCLPGASRQDTCVPAPAEGLCLAGVGYDDQDAADSRSL